MPFLLIILLFLSSATELFPTAVSLQILIGHNNTLIFLIGEHHEAANTHPGGNDAIIQKLLTILKNSEKQSGGGFRLFIESGADQIFKTSDDLLNRIIVEQESLPKSSFEDIEQLRNLSMAASHIFMYPDPFFFSVRFRPLSSAGAERHAEFRKKCQKRYGCDLNTLTFTQIFDLYEKQLEMLRTKKNEWPSPLLSHLAARLKEIERNIEELSALLVQFDITFSESIITEAVRLHQNDSIAYRVGKGFTGKTGFFDAPINVQIKLAIDSAHNGIFDLMILDRILQACSKDSSKPILVIAGDGHIRELALGFKELGCTPLHDFRERIGNSSRYVPIRAELLDMLEQPQELFLAAHTAATQEKAWYPCLIL